MDTNIFRYILEVDDCRNITLAAKRLFISQPALSKQITNLEKKLGVVLFDRSHSPISITPQGEIFVDFARRYVRMEEEMFDAFQRVNQDKLESVSIATTHRGGAYAGILTAQLMSLFPEIKVEYLNRSSAECESELESEAVDLAVYTEPVFSDQIEYLPVQEDPLIFVIPKEHPILEGLNVEGNNPNHPIEIDIDRFRDPSIKYLLANPGQGLYYAENSFFKKYHITPINPERIEYVDTRYQVACSGYGIALLPKITIIKYLEQSNEIYGVVKGDSMYRYVIVARKKSRQLSPAAEKVWRFMVRESINFR